MWCEPTWRPRRVGPVCSPEYLRQKRIESVGDLARAKLMVSRPTSAAGRKWSSW
jgi:LysR family glycine cleavage system transcriptional activator